jgi:hypothetical protein
MVLLYNISMSNAKNEDRTPVKSPFSGFSRFGNQKNKLGTQKFTPKTFNARPVFITQHKGGGGK